jgi:carboxyl-terminal processing protease
MRRAGAIACGALLLAGASTGWLAFHRDAAPTPPPPPAPVYAPVPDPGALHGRGLYPTSTQAPASPILVEVRDALRSSYYRFVPESVLDAPSLEQMLDGLDDPYTEYLDPLEYELLREQLARTYFGVGLTVGPGNGGLLVTSSLDGPAREAGIRPGDLIVRIDGRPARDLPFDRSAALIKGEKGTVVQLTVRRPGQAKRYQFTVVRTEIEVPSVRSRMIKTKGHRLGYLRVSSFRDDVAARVVSAVRRLGDAGAEAFVLDLRGDPGGLLEQAVQLTSVFLAQGLVCSTSGLHETRSYYVSGSAIETARPLVVLVDPGTASAAEIVAAALSDNGRAVLVGRRTYGKATVQTLLVLSNGGALKLTTATYLTPSGESIRERGIKPAVKALDDPLTEPDEALVTASKVLLDALAVEEPQPGKPWFPVGLRSPSG